MFLYVYLLLADCLFTARFHPQAPVLLVPLAKALLLVAPARALLLVALVLAQLPQLSVLKEIMQTDQRE